MKILFERGIVDMKDYDRVKYYDMSSTFKPKFSVYVERGIGLIDKRIASFTKEEYAKKFMEDFLNRVKNTAGGKGKGFFWWEPAWIPVKGSGWATPASLKYINDPGPCGNEWANQALFDYEGNALPTWNVIRDFK